MEIRFPKLTDDDPKRRRIARWMEKQRASYRHGTLSLEWIQKLEQLPGWSWVSSDDADAEEAEE